MMMRTALLLMVAVVSQASVSTAQTAGTASADGTLPVSLDRIRKALTVQAPPTSPLRVHVDAEANEPQFSVRIEAPRTLVLRSYLDDGTAVPAYVRPPFDPVHYEFLEMVTPDDVKGCAQFDEKACLTSTAGRVATGLMWQRLTESGVDRARRQIFVPRR